MSRLTKGIRPSTNILINYLPNDFGERDLEELCKGFGSIQSRKVITDTKTGRSKCFGFVNFSTVSEAERAIRSLNGKRIRQKRLLAKFACSKAYYPTSEGAIEVINWNEDAHRQLEEFGRIESVFLTAGKSVLIVYESDKCAEEAVKQLNGEKTADGTIRIIMCEDSKHVCFRNERLARRSEFDIDSAFFSESDEDCEIEDQRDEGIGAPEFVLNSKNYSDMMFMITAQCH